jgi:hypothetical protein
MSSAAKSDIELLKILQGYDLSLFKKIRQWRHNSRFIYQHEMDPEKYHKATRDAIIGKLAQRYGLQNLKPKVIAIQTPMLKVNCEIVVFPFGESMVSLLTTPGATDPENLVIDQKDPFKTPQVGGDDGYLDDINTGSVHVEAHKKYCTGPTDILAELVAFCDKSYVDKNGKLTLEPLMFTLGIFNRKYRNNPKAWRPMGYIPNLDHLAPKGADAKKKLHDYHFCMRIIMSEMIEYQKLGGIDWRMLIDGKWIDVRFQIPLAFVIGDTEGHDKMAGHKIDRVTMTNKQCQYCDVDHEDCDNPHVVTKLTTKEEIQNLRREKTQTSIAYLENELSYRQIDDAFDEVVFSDWIRGIHGSTPAEVIHAVNLGLEERAITSVFSMKRETGKARGRGGGGPKKKKIRLAARDSDSDSEDEMQSESEKARVYQPAEGEDKSRVSILTTFMCDYVDKQCKALHKQLQWQSDTDMPRINFPTGISSLSKMTANERAGVLLLLLLVFCMDNMHYTVRKFKKEQTKIKKGVTGFLVQSMGEELMRNVVKGISLLLLFEWFLKCTRVPLTCIQSVKAFVPDMLESIFRVFTREEGTQHKTIKSHLPTHAVDDIYRQGSAENFNSGPGESSHIDNIKVPGRNTQKRARTFAVQCSNQYCNNNVINRAWLDHPNWEQTKEPAEELKVGKAWFTVTETKVLSGEPTARKVGEIGTCRRSCIKARLGDWKLSGVSVDELLDTVRNKILPCLSAPRHVTVHRTFTKGEVKFQANPDYGQTKLPRQHWAIMEKRLAKKGGGYNIEDIPVHLQCIIHVDQKPEQQITFDLGTVVGDKGYYFLAHMIDRELKDSGPHREPDDDWGEDWDYGTLAENNQHLIHIAVKRKVIDPDKPVRDALIAIPIGDIKGTLVGVLDPNHTELEKKFYYFISNCSSWADIFIHVAAKHAVEDG